MQRCLCMTFSLFMYVTHSGKPCPPLSPRSCFPLGQGHLSLPALLFLSPRPGRAPSASQFSSPGSEEVSWPEVMVFDPHTRRCLTSTADRLFIQWRLKLDGALFFFYKEGWKCRCGIGIGVVTANHWSYGSIWRQTPWTLGPLSSGAGRLLSTCNIFFSLFCPIWNNNMKHFPVRLCMRAVVPVSHARGKALSVWHSCSSSRINSPLPKPTYALVLYSHSACVQSCCL